MVDETEVGAYLGQGSESSVRIDILLVPIAGGYFTVTPNEAKESYPAGESQDRNPDAPLVRACRAGIHARSSTGQNAQEPVLKISKAELPQPIETIVMPWGER